MADWQDVTGWDALVARCLAAQAQRRAEVRAAEVSVARVVEGQASEYPARKGPRARGSRPVSGGNRADEEAQPQRAKSAKLGRKRRHATSS